MVDKARELDARAARQRALAEAGDPDAAGRATWAAQRANAIRLDRSAYLDRCDRSWATVSCACGPKRFAVGCEQPWICERCRRRYYKRVRRRLARACRRWERAKGGWKWRLVGLSVRHTGDLARDRAALTEGWRRFRQWLHSRFGAVPFALLWEVTPGSTGDGHVHAHVIALLPTGRDASGAFRCDYGELRKAWLRSCPESEVFYVETARKGGAGAAVYAAKYASKGVDLAEMPGQLAGRVMHSFYAKRKVTTSHRFYCAVGVESTRPCRECGEKETLTGRPAGVSSTSLEWARLCRRHGVDASRAPPQKHLWRNDGSQKETAP